LSGAASFVTSVSAATAAKIVLANIALANASVATQKAFCLQLPSPADIALVNVSVATVVDDGSSQQ
jgi:hypothetical protein